ncbi:tetraspanin-32 [Pleurodeles waltl]|uniref:tetraspanin-32 n=1 Tax=Pleurodeles waltl TaxID=8319 RepID=UPI0037094297
MAEKQWVRVAKCQLLVASAFILLLALAVSILAIITHSGGQFTVFSDVPSAKNVYQAVRGAVLPSGICLSIVLVLSGVLSTFAVVKESQGLMMTGFLCFALEFCVVVQAVLWKQERGTEVEGAVLDIYDSVYEKVRQNSSGPWRQELIGIHQMFLCCGKYSPLQRPGGFEGNLCPTEDAAIISQDCLQVMEAFLSRHMWYVSSLLLLTLGFTVYGMTLTSFLLFYIRIGITWDRKGKYILAQH